MTCSAPIKVDDVGTVMRAYIVDCSDDSPIDLTGYVELEMIFKTPSGVVFTRPAFVHLGNPLLGIIEYILEPGDITQKGTWRLQGRVVYDDGQVSSDIIKFRVRENLDD